MNYILITQMCYRVILMVILAVISWTWYKQKVLIVHCAAVLMGIIGVGMVFEHKIQTVAHQVKDDIEFCNLKFYRPRKCLAQRAIQPADC